MKIGINGVSVVTGGNVTYFANLLPILGDLLAARGDTAFVYTREGSKVAVPASPGLVERRVASARMAGGRRAAWDQTALPWFARKDGVDLFFGPTDSVPLVLDRPTVCAFRNLNIYVPVLETSTEIRNRLIALRGLALASAWKCTRAIFVSAAARDDIAPVLRLNPAKARIVHHGIGGVFRAALTGANPWDRPYILTVSTQYDYKNTPRLIEAFDKYVRRRGLPHGLAVVGGLAEKLAEADILATLKRLNVGDSVRLVGQVGYPDVGAWYRHAAAFAFPSWRESFGHPLLEAMAAELPIVAADTAVMHEVGGDAAIYCDPFSMDAIGEGLAAVLDDAKRNDLIARGRERLKEFSWAKAAEKTLRVIDEAAN